MFDTSKLTDNRVKDRKDKLVTKLTDDSNYNEIIDCQMSILHFLLLYAFIRLRVLTLHSQRCKEFGLNLIDFYSSDHSSSPTLISST